MRLRDVYFCCDVVGTAFVASQANFDPEQNQWTLD